MTPRSVVLLGFAIAIAAGLPLWAWAGGAALEGAGQRAAGAIEQRYLGAASEFHSLRGNTKATPAQWRRIAGKFLEIYKNYHTPAARRADSLFSAALALRSASEAGGGPEVREEALARFQQFASNFPRHRLADDSLMHVGSLHGRREQDAARALLAYRRVLLTYPGGDQAPLARQRVAELTKPRPPEGKAAPVVGAPPKGRRPFGTKPAGLPKPATIKRILFSSLPEFTRVILTTDRAVPYTYRELSASEGRPPRFYIDLQNSRPREGLAAEHVVDDSVLSKIRISMRKSNTTRVVFDLKAIKRFEVKELRLPYEKKIIVDFYPVTALAALARRPDPEHRLPAAPIETTSLRNTLGLKVRNLIIDPGHGGRDPGAVAFGITEKQVALRISRELREVFRRKRPDIQVSLTRDRDIFIALGRRPAIAKKAEADLFVSIHLNAHEQERFFGIETYFLNLTSDASALRVAARENATTEKQIGDLNVILTDLLRDTNMVESSKLAYFLQRSLVGGLRGVYPVRDLGVKQAPFMVLIGAEMPSVLVEAGFLTNRKENRRLRKAAYLRRLANGIFEGLRKYIQEQTFALDFPDKSTRQANQDS